MNTAETTTRTFRTINEDPWVRERFEGELAARGLTTEMPPEAYRDPGYSWR